ncbi:hypothetical protein J5N97_014440 [Dioscorea zingiberensis]|uniref:NAC domain-containing protein n=1 Tax=Dioscorea zingiberensis TaxID=325984 RepID=A0A9D5CSG4_9LILI|nr:hypothetical protein J5N97_014440 [Dioscorea zingiberensis]
MEHGEGEGFRLPEGFRFKPTDEDLILYYLRPKVSGQELPCKVIKEDINVYGTEPWNLIPPSIDEDYFFFLRPYRRRNVGSSARWITTGVRKAIKEGGDIIGYKNSLAFKILEKKNVNTGWVMHEYELPSPMGRANTNGLVWVICRIKRNKHFEKKRTRCDEDGVSIGDQEFSLLSSQGASKKMACHARGWEQESVEDVPIDFNSSLFDKEIMCANNGMNELSFDDFFNISNDGFMDIPSGWQEELHKQ